jgi:7-keto-8-aminopelargonate synthetase-like enzyme
MTIEGRHQWLAQQRQKCAGICQDAALLNKYSDGTALMDEEKKRVQRLQKNAQQRKHRRKDTVPMMKAEMLPIVSVCLSWKMNMIAISLYLYLLYLKRRWKTYTCGS